MTTWPPRFDDALNRRLEECAREAGEDVDTYVARAVATQMLAGPRRADSPSLGTLLTHLSDSTVLAAPAMPDVSASINDPDRLSALYATGLLDSPPEELYDQITRVVSTALDVPFAAVSLVDVDRQYFKSSIGLSDGPLGARQTPLEMSVCQYAVANGSTLVLEDARVDPVFKNHPSVLNGSLVAYLGVPLTDDKGNAVGVLCAIDLKPRLWATGHVQILSDLAKLVAERIFGSGPSTDH